MPSDLLSIDRFSSMDGTYALVYIKEKRSYIFFCNLCGEDRASKEAFNKHREREHGLPELGAWSRGKTHRNQRYDTLGDEEHEQDHAGLAPHDEQEDESQPPADVELERQASCSLQFINQTHSDVAFKENVAAVLKAASGFSFSFVLVVAVLGILVGFFLRGELYI